MFKRYFFFSMLFMFKSGLGVREIFTYSKTILTIGTEAQI